MNINRKQRSVITFCKFFGLVPHLTRASGRKDVGNGAGTLKSQGSQEYRFSLNSYLENLKNLITFCLFLVPHVTRASGKMDGGNGAGPCKSQETPESH